MKPRSMLGLVLVGAMACQDADLTAPTTTTTTATTHLTSLLYETTFPLDENPIHEGGTWLNGASDGLRWSNVRTAGGRAWGLQTALSFRDATALRTGVWPADQYAEATVFVTTVGLPKCHQEVELRLRSAIGPNVSRGYEVYWLIGRFSSNSYIAISRWNGPVGSYQRILKKFGIQYGVVNGDVLRAEIVGTTIRAYKNGVLQAQITDPQWVDGAPGMGFNLENSLIGCPGTNANYGYSDFRAGAVTGGPPPPPPPPPPPGDP